jgi:hypothetical protein
MADRKQIVTGVFRNRVDAEKAFDYLYANGYRDSEINVLMSDSTRSTFYPTAADKDKHSAGTLATEGMGVGGAIGTAVGATLAAVAVTAASIVLPGVGTAAGLVIAGPLAAALAGGGAGAVAGGLIGALVGAGMTEQNAEAYSEALKNGGVVVGVHPHSSDDASRIEKKFQELGGENVCCC